MDELTFLLILAGIGVILLIAMFTYYKHHKKIDDEIKEFNYHAEDIDDVLLQENSQKHPSFSDAHLNEEDMPGSFSASKQDTFDIDQVNLNIGSTVHSSANSQSESHQINDNESEIIDGVYVNSKRVISNSKTTETPVPSFKKTVDTFGTFANSNSGDGSLEPSARREPSAHKEPSATTFQKTAARTEKTAERTQTFYHQQVPKKSAEMQQNVQQKIKIVYDPVPEGVQELIISHTILSRGEFIKGKDLFNAIQSAGLYFGEMNIFHYPGNEDAETFALFSIANVVEPGIFDLSTADTFTTPGISMFMRLPTRIDNYEAYEEFIHIAQMIAEELDGELCDETRSQLTQQAIGYKKEQIRKLNFELIKAEKLAGMNK